MSIGVDLTPGSCVSLRTVRLDARDLRGLLWGSSYHQRRSLLITTGDLFLSPGGLQCKVCRTSIVITIILSVMSCRPGIGSPCLPVLFKSTLPVVRVELLTHTVVTNHKDSWTVFVSLDYSAPSHLEDRRNCIINHFTNWSCGFFIIAHLQVCHCYSGVITEFVIIDY